MGIYNVKFKTTTKYSGGTRYNKCSGLELWDGDLDHFQLTPINGRGDLSMCCYINVPKDAIDDLINALQTIKNTI